MAWLSKLVVVVFPVARESTNSLELLVVPLEDVDSDKYGACCDLGGPEIEEFRIIQCKFTELESHLLDNRFLVEAQQSEVALGGDYRVGKTQIE